MHTHTASLVAPALVEEAPGPYLGLLAVARDTAGQIAATDAEGLTGSAAYLHRASCGVMRVAASSEPGDDVSAFAASEALRRVAAAWPSLAAGAKQGEQIFASDPALWVRLMTEWPMGGYASLAAQFLLENRLLGGQVIELGAGVGSCSALVADHAGDGYIRTDLQPALLKRQRIRGSVSRYDFNEPGAWRDVDTIFAVNALHCAADTTVTLGYLRDMLRPGGTLVLGEGAPRSDARGTPCPLNLVLGLFRGWWDIGGFLPRDTWTSALASAGFRNVGWTVRRTGEHDLGGLIWAQR